MFIFIILQHPKRHYIIVSYRITMKGACLRDLLGPTFNKLENCLCDRSLNACARALDNYCKMNHAH